MAGLNLSARMEIAWKALTGTLNTIAPNSAGGQLLRGIYPGASGMPPRMGTRQTLQAYEESPWLHAVASRIAKSVASVEWQLYISRESKGRPDPKTGKRKAIKDRALQKAGPNRRKSLLAEREDSGDLEQVQSHLFLDVLDKPNGFMTGLMFRQATQLHLDLVGETFWLKERNRMGAIVGLWSIPPHWVLMTPTPTTPQYRVGWRSWQGWIPDTEIVWMRDVSPEFPYGRGIGTANALADEIETDEYIAKTLRQNFFNGARPDFIAYPKGQDAMQESERKIWQNDWLAQHQGFWRVFKPMFANREVGIYEFKADNRKLQLSELRQQERDIIIQVFGGIPPEMLGIQERSNRATISAASFIYAQYSLLPRLELLRTVFQEQIIPEYDDRLIVDYVSPVPNDEQAQEEVVKAMPWAFKIDEIRQRGGFPALKGDAGQIHMVPIQLQPMQDFIGEPIMPGTGDPMTGEMDLPLNPQPAARPDRTPRAAEPNESATGNPSVLPPTQVTPSEPAATPVTR